VVLESLFEGESVVKHPLAALFLGFVFTSVSLWIAFFSFPASASILAISFITIAAVPMIHHVFLIEERKALKLCAKKGSFFARNFDLIKVYSWFSIGVIVGFAAWFMVLPAQGGDFCLKADQCVSVPSQEIVFKEQSTALSYISAMAPDNQNATANATLNGGACGGSFWCWFNLIFTNNSSLMLMAVLLSFIFGAGALFLITWNASIVGILIGKNILAENHFGFLGLLPHGIPEFAGFFMGAISGGMISIAVTQRKNRPREFEIIAMDAFILLLLALLSLFVGAAVEAFSLIGQDVFAAVLSAGYLLAMTWAIFKTQL